MYIYIYVYFCSGNHNPKPKSQSWKACIYIYLSQFSICDFCVWLTWKTTNPNRVGNVSLKRTLTWDLSAYVCFFLPSNSWIHQQPVANVVGTHDSTSFQKNQTLKQNFALFSFQICQTDRYPKDIYDTLQLTSLGIHHSKNNDVPR